MIKYLRHFVGLIVVKTILLKIPKTWFTIATFPIKKTPLEEHCTRGISAPILINKSHKCPTNVVSLGSYFCAKKLNSA